MLRRLEPGYFARICAIADGYSPAACAAPIELTAETSAEVTLSLRARKLQTGRVLVDGPIAGGLLYRVTAAGVILETIPVNEDGRFVFTGEGVAGAIVVSSTSHPLFAVPHPPSNGDRRELQIVTPPGRIRRFTVEFSETMDQREGWFTILIGDIVVPINALGTHLTRRGLVARVEAARAAPVTAILESAPVRVLAIVGSYPQPQSVADLFVSPQYAGIRELRPVPADGRVIFGRSPDP